jgi:small-conductance mechanosensitive channel
MVFENLTYDVLRASLWIWPLISIFSGIIAGAVFAKFIHPKLVGVASKTKWSVDDVILASLKHYFVLWFALAGFWGAILTAMIPENVRRLLETIWFIIAAFSIVFAFAQSGTDLLAFYARKREGILQATTMFRLLILSIATILGILIILNALKINITPMVAALGIGGLAVALALQDPLGNFFSGLHILASSEIRPGDYLRLDSGEEGFVTDISWRTTAIKTLSSNTTLVPNLKLSKAIITNYHLDGQQLSVPIDVEVSYDSDLDKVEQITLEVANAVLNDTPGGIPEVKPRFQLTRFGSSGIDFTVSLRVKNFDYQYPIRHAFIKKLHKKYGEMGIKITPVKE